MEETLPKAVGRRIAERREAIGLKQQELGARIGLTDHSAIGQWERGETTPGLLNLAICAEELQLSLDYLVWGMGNNIDEKLLSLPAALRESLVTRFLVRIEEAEKLVKEHPELFSEENVVRDGDRRLRPWSAHRKIKLAEAMAKRKTRKGVP